MTERKLYTIIAEYNGGTYIGQSFGDSPAAALSGWLSSVQDVQLAGWGVTRQELTTIAKEDDPVAISGCVGVWCVTGSVKRGLVLINVVATDAST